MLSLIFSVGCGLVGCGVFVVGYRVGYATARTEYADKLTRAKRRNEALMKRVWAVPDARERARRAWGL